MQNELSNTVNRRVSEGELDVPLLPGVLVDIMALVDDPDADVRRLADLVHRDPGLAAHVLRVANSPVFSARGGVVSLQQAVSRLGFRLLGEIAMSAVVTRSVFKDQAGCPQIEDLRRDSLATGVWAREIARLRRVSVESAFLCGLLQRIGAPVALAEAVRSARAMEMEISTEVLDRVMLEVEADVGLKVAEAWRLPSAVRACIAHRSDPLAAREHRHEVLVSGLAALLVPLTFDADADEDAVLSDPVVQALSLYPEDVEELLDRRDAVVETLQAMCR